MRQLDPGSVVEGLRIERELGRGAFGTVYLAEDELLGRRVAVKVMQLPEAEGQTDRGLLEARAAARIKSAHIVMLHRVHTLPGSDGWLLEMEYVEGGTLDDLLERETKLPPDRALPLLRQVLAGLRAAHEAGVVHGDIKPGNVLLERDGSAKLGDFGLSWLIDDTSLSSMAARCPVGTPSYMAPEIIMGEANSPASDIWSLGVLVYRMLAGTHPFDTSNFQQLFFSVLNAPIPELPASMPAVIRELLPRLLARQPEQRVTAAEALEALEDAPSATPAAAPPESPTPLASVPELFGREKETARVESLLDALADGRGSALLVTGDDGCGKTALLELLAARATARGFRHVEATVTALEGLLGPLLRAARHAAPARLAVPGLSPELARNLLEGRLDVEFGSRNQIASSVTQIFGALARERSVVLTIENAHEADPEDQRLLRDLAIHLPEAGLLVAVSWRTHDVHASTPESRGLAGLPELSSVRGLRALDLKPLGPEAMHRLIERHVEAHHIDSGLVQRVIALAEGNPLFALEMLRHLQAEGAIVSHGSSIRMRQGWEETRLPGRFTDLVARRLAGLAEDQRELLDAAAVDGRDFDGEAIEAVTGRTLLGVLRDLQRLYRERHLVEPHGDGYRFTSPVIREVIYAELAPALRRAMHRRLAEHLEGRDDGVDPARLGLHWEQAGAPERAVAPLMAAAGAAAARHETRRVVDFCTRAGMEPGRIDTPSALRWMPTLLRLATTLCSMGRVDEMDRLFEDLLAATGEAGDEEAGLRVRVWRARMLYQARGCEAVDREELLHAADRLPSGVEVGDAHFLLGMLDKTLGRLESADRWILRASEEFRAIGEPVRVAATVLQRAAVALRAERFDEARERFREASGLYAAEGHAANAAIAEVNAALASLQSGDLAGTEERLAHAVRTLTLHGVGPIPAAHVVLAQVQYAAGRIDDAWSRIVAAHAYLEEYETVAGREAVFTEEAHLALVRGELGRADETLRQAREAAERGGHVMGQVTIAALEAQLRAVEGDHAGACDAARRARESAAATEEPGTRTEPVSWLAEAVLYGLPVDALPEGDHPFLAAARGGAVAEEGPPAGRRAATLACAWRVWRADAAMRDGESAAALDLASTAARDARAFGHVWLEIAALGRVCAWSADADAPSRRDALLRKAAESLPSPADRPRLVDAWRVRDQSI